MQRNEEEMSCSTEIYEEIVATLNALSCSTGTNCATVQQRTECFQKQVHKETWLFSLTECLLGREGEGEKESEEYF